MNDHITVGFKNDKKVILEKKGQDMSEYRKDPDNEV
jgi:hypothetical protein